MPSGELIDSPPSSGESRDWLDGSGVSFFLFPIMVALKLKNGVVGKLEEWLLSSGASLWIYRPEEDVSACGIRSESRPRITLAYHSAPGTRMNYMQHR